VGSALSAPAPGAAANADQEADERSRRILRDREEIANRMREGLERLRERSRLGDGERREAPVYGAEELASEDPNVRIDAVEMIDVEDEGLEPMLRVLETDPDHRVREAVAERLSMEEGPQVSAALVGALDDPHPKVRLAAIEALEFVDDPSTIPDLERLYDDVDPEVADAAREAVEFLK
jgi:HEAT repeat protein